MEGSLRRFHSRPTEDILGSYWVTGRVSHMRFTLLFEDPDCPSCLVRQHVDLGVN
jgi:hypothetical protein